jgi:hypothetical protein
MNKKLGGVDHSRLHGLARTVVFRRFMKAGGGAKYLTVKLIET